MKKKDETPPKPVPRLQDMSLSDISRMNVDAIENGDPTKVLEVMRASIEAEAPIVAPPRYVIDLPVLQHDDHRAIGLALSLLYVGSGPEVAIVLPSGERFVVHLPQLAGAVQALQSAMFAAPPPQLFPIGRR
jgi:hypothetical protein